MKWKEKFYEFYGNLSLYDGDSEYKIMQFISDLLKEKYLKTKISKKELYVRGLADDAIKYAFEERDSKSKGLITRI